MTTLHSTESSPFFSAICRESGLIRKWRWLWRTFTHLCTLCSRSQQRESSSSRWDYWSAFSNISLWRHCSLSLDSFLSHLKTYVHRIDSAYLFIFSILQEEFDSQYGPQYDSALEKLLWEFLTRLDQLLPVPDLAQVWLCGVVFFYHEFNFVLSVADFA